MEYITKTNGPCIILAGAGTGKTRSIIEKLRYIINNNVYDPEKIVCLTFSNEAVNTLKERMLPFIKNKEPIIMTFHSFCAELLRKHGEKIGINPKFKIITPDDGKILLHKHFKIAPILCNRYLDEISISKDLGKNIESFESQIKSSDQISQIAKILEDLKFKINTSHINKISKSELETIKEKAEKTEEELKKAKFQQAWSLYEKIKVVKSGLDYPDLHHKALELLEKNPDVANEFEYIIVDEFQDTNKLQCQILEKLAIKKDITIVGDLNQSIYRFRGAYDENFAYFKKAMNATNKDIYNLDKSHRSTNKILNIAHELIKNNYENQKDCFRVKNAYNIEGEKIKAFELKNNKEEVRKIIEIIKDEISKNTKMNEICIVFRTHQQTAMLKKQLEYENIPYTSASKESLLKEEKIRLVRAYIDLANKIESKSNGAENPLWTILNYSIKNKEDCISATKLINEWKKQEKVSEKFINENFNLSEQGKIQIHTIKRIVNQIIEKIKSPSHEIVKTTYELLGFHEIPQTIPLMEKFLSFTKEFSESESPDLGSFLHHLSIIDSLEIIIEPPSISKNGIKIMTNHATKGLEYEAVIIASLVQKKFPIEKENKFEENNPEENLKKQIMEERRLCYVGFTRAKKRLYLTYASEYGQRKYEPSQFLKEINYQNNEDIEFIKDDAELYKTPEAIMSSAAQLEKNQEDEKISFSPSALQLFDECQKRYEMRYIYNMPDPAPQSWEAITLGKYVHKVLEEAVRKNCKNIKEVEDCAKIVQMEEYPEAKLEEAMPLIKVFFERNKSKYNESSRIEEFLYTTIEGILFNGFADRIDIDDEGNLTIIDYKTGKSDIKPRYRNWQLGIYALASKKFGNPKRLILDMLQKETPLEFEIDNNGIAKEIHSARTYFSLNEVKKEIVEIAKKIIESRKKGFKFCNLEKNCQFCQDLEKNKNI